MRPDRAFYDSDYESTLVNADFYMRERDRFSLCPRELYISSVNQRTLGNLAVNKFIHVSSK